MSHKTFGELIAPFVIPFGWMATLMLPLSVSAQQYNLVTDFSAGNNPNGPWSYGYRNSTQLFQPFNQAVGNAYGVTGLYAFSSSALGTEPNIIFNSKNTSVTFKTVQMDPLSIQLHPGPNLEKAVVKWTAPTAGLWQVDANFRGNDIGGTSTIVSVLQGRGLLFSQAINGYRASASYSSAIKLFNGETLDFLVDPNGNYGSDSTGISINIKAIALPPVCSLTASPSSIVSGDTTYLTASCTNTPSSYEWSYSGCSRSSSTCAVTPSATTSYSVAGTNGGGLGANSSTTVSVTYPMPVCSLLASPAVIPAGGISTLTASCTNTPTSYSWTDASCSSSSNVCRIKPAVATNYGVAGVNAGGAGIYTYASVTIAAPVPVCQLTASRNSVSAGEAVTLTANCTNDPVSYNWVNTNCPSTSNVCTTNPSATATYGVAGVNAAGAGLMAQVNVSVTQTKVEPPYRPDMECLFDWAESILPDILYPNSMPTKGDGSRTYRQYASGITLLIDGLGGIWGQGGVVGPNATVLGHMRDFLPSANAALCGAIPPANIVSGPTASTVEVFPDWLHVSASQSYINSDRTIAINGDSMSYDGSVIVFKSQVSDNFGLPAPRCSINRVYYYDAKLRKLNFGVTDFAGNPVCGVFPGLPAVNGNGNYIYFADFKYPFRLSTREQSGYYRTLDNFGYGYTPLNVYGPEVSLNDNGSLGVSMIKGIVVSGRPSFYGHKAVFTLDHPSGVSGLVDDQPFDALFFTDGLTNLRADLVNNQDTQKNHFNTYDAANYFLSSDGDTLVYIEPRTSNDVAYNNYKVYRPSAKAGQDLFANNRIGPSASNQIDASTSLCGISGRGGEVLIDHTVSTRTRNAFGIDLKALGGKQLSIYNHVFGIFEHAAVAEDSYAALNGRCADRKFTRQLSDDANRVLWNVGEYFYIRDRALQSTIKFKAPTNMDFGHQRYSISGNGKYVIYLSDKSPSGTLYKESNGIVPLPQIFRMGPIENSMFINKFTMENFEANIRSQQ